MSKLELKRDIIDGKYNGVEAGVYCNSAWSGIILLNWDDEKVEGCYSYQSDNFMNEDLKQEYTDNMRLFSVKMRCNNAGDYYFIYNGTRYNLDLFMRQTIDAGIYEDKHVKRNIRFK